MGERIQAFDWSATPLGPVQTWPERLKGAVDNMLASGLPGYVWWGPELIQLYNDAALGIVGAGRPEPLGAPAREGWADVWAAVGPLVERVLSTGRAEIGEDLAMVRESGGEPETGFFTFSYSALRDETGAMAGLLVTAIETTQRVLAERALREGQERQTFLLKLSDTLRPLGDPLSLVQKAAEHTWGPVQRARAETELHESEARLQAATDLVGLACYTWNPRRGVHWDARLKALWGLPPEAKVDYPLWLSAIHPEDRARVEASLANAMDPDGDGIWQSEYRVIGVEDGVERWISTYGRTYFEDRRPVGFIGAARDVTRRREWSERLQVLVGELQHRTRNLLGLVRVTADKTLRSSADLEDFSARFRDRLDALARVQALLSRLDEGDRITFDEVIRCELKAMAADPSRITLEGPSGVRLRSSTVQTLAMALHELATNAVKYGALGQAGARLAVSWALQPETDEAAPRLKIDWRESGVTAPPPTPDVRGGGHGRELIERALPYQLQARTTYRLTADGVHCTIDAPISATPPREP